MITSELTALLFLEETAHSPEPPLGTCSEDLTPRTAPELTAVNALTWVLVFLPVKLALGTSSYSR